MAHMKLSHSLVLLGILPLILVLSCFVTGAPSVGNHHASSLLPQDESSISGAHDADQPPDSVQPKSHSLNTASQGEQKTTDEESDISHILKDDSSLRGDVAELDDSIWRLTENQAGNGDVELSLLETKIKAEELIEQTTPEQINSIINDINPSAVIKNEFAVVDSDVDASGIPFPRTAPPLQDVIQARLKLGLELHQLSKELKQGIDTGEQSPLENDLHQINSFPEPSLSDESSLRYQSLLSSATAVKDDLNNDLKLATEDLVIDSSPDNNLPSNENQIKGENVQFIAKTKEYLNENEHKVSSSHEVEQSLPDVKVLLDDTVKELLDKADDYVVGFESLSEVVGDSKDLLPIEPENEFISPSNAGGDPARKKNIGDETTEPRLLVEEDSEELTRNRVARVSRVLDNAALDRHGQHPSPPSSHGPTAGPFQSRAPESSYNSGLLGNGPFSLRDALRDEGCWAQSHFPVAEKKVEAPFADLKTKKQTSVGGYDHQPQQGPAKVDVGGQLDTLVGLFPMEGDPVKAAADAPPGEGGDSSSDNSNDKDERDIDGRGSLEDTSSFEIEDATLLNNLNGGDVSVEDDVESLIGNHKKVIAATPTLKPGRTRQTSPLEPLDVKEPDAHDHVTHETKSALESGEEKVSPKEKPLRLDQTNGVREGKADKPAEGSDRKSGLNGADQPVGSALKITSEDITGTSVNGTHEELKDSNAEQPQQITKKEAHRHKIVTRDGTVLDRRHVDEANKITESVGAGSEFPALSLNEVDTEQDQSKTEKATITGDVDEASDLIQTHDAPETISADQLTNKTSTSSEDSGFPLVSDSSESEPSQKEVKATGKSTDEVDPPVVTDSSKGAPNVTGESNTLMQKPAEDGLLPGVIINGTKEQEDSIETYSQFAERVAMEKLNDGGGGSGGVVGGTGGVASPTKLGPSKKYNNKNYAGTDCGSKLLSANPEAQHASKVIQSNRDEYLLNDCKGKTWFVVELCESIRPSRFEIANFELFSNLPRDISVLGSQRYPTRDWTLLGDYTGQEGSRGVQPFDIQTETFFKYIKVEINSHYGTEYYCPVSLFRVFGVSEFEVIDSLEDGADDVDDEPLEQQEEPVKGGKEEKKERSMLPMVLRSMLTNVLGVLNRGASLSISSHSNQTPPVDECTSLDPRYKIDENKCSLAPTINWHLGCYDAEYKYVLKLPIVKKTVENREFCKSLVDNLCGEKGHKEMREDDVKPGESSLNGSQVDLDFACSTRVCGNSYVCVMLCSHHLLALCHIKHYNLAVNPSSSASSGRDSALSPSCTGNDSITPKNLSTNSNFVPKDPVDKEPVPNYILKESAVKAERDLEKDELPLHDTSAHDPDKKDCGKQDDPVSESSIDQENSTTDTNEPKLSGTSESSDETKDKGSNNGSSNIVKEKPAKKEKESKDTGLGTKSSKEKKVSDTKRTEPGSSINGENVNGHRNGEPNGQNGSPLPTVEQDPQPSPKESNGNAVQKESNGHGSVVTPPNKESVVVRLSNKIKVLEHNLSISSQYLEELSKRYKRQMEEMQQQFSSAVTALNKSTPSEEEIDRRRLADERMDHLQQQMEQLTQIVNRLAVDQERLATRVVEQHLLLMFAEVIVLFIAFYVCMRRQRAPPPHQQPLQVALSSQSPPQRPSVMGSAGTPGSLEAPRRRMSPLALSWQSSGGGNGGHGKKEWKTAGGRDCEDKAVGMAEPRRGSIDSATGLKLKSNLKTNARRGSTENLRIAGSYRSLLIEDGGAAASETVTRRRRRKGKVTIKRSNSSLPTCGSLSSSRTPPPRGTKKVTESLQTVLQFSSQQQSPQSWTAKLESRKRQPTSSCLARFGESTKCSSANVRTNSPTSSDGKNQFQRPWSPAQVRNSSQFPWHVSNSRSRSISGSSSATDGSVKSVNTGSNNRLNPNLARLLLSQQTKVKSRNSSKESPRESDKKQKLNQSSAGVLFSCERQNMAKKNTKTKSEPKSVGLFPTNSKDSSLSSLPDNVVARRHHSMAVVPYQNRWGGDFLSLNFKVNNLGDEHYPSSTHDNSSNVTPFSRRIGSVVTSASDPLAHVSTSFFLNADTDNKLASSESINPLPNPFTVDSNHHLRKELPSVSYSTPAPTGYSGLMRISECSESSSALTLCADLELLSDTDSPAHSTTHQVWDGVFWRPSDEKRPRRDDSFVLPTINNEVTTGDSCGIDSIFTSLKLHSVSDVSPLSLSKEVLSVSSNTSNVASSDSGFHQLMTETAHPSSIGTFNGSRAVNTTTLSTASAPTSWRCNGVAVTDDNHPLFSGDQFPELPSFPAQNNSLVFSSQNGSRVDLPVTDCRGSHVVVNGHSMHSMNGHKKQGHSSQRSNGHSNNESQKKIGHKRAGSDGSISYMKSSANKVDLARGSLNAYHKEAKGNINRKNSKKSKRNTGNQRHSYGSVVFDKPSATNGGIGSSAEGAPSDKDQGSHSSSSNKVGTNTSGSPPSYRASFDRGRNDGRGSTSSSMMKTFTSSTTTASSSKSKKEGS